MAINLHSHSDRVGKNVVSRGYNFCRQVRISDVRSQYRGLQMIEKLVKRILDKMTVSH